MKRMNNGNMMPRKKSRWKRIAIRGPKASQWMKVPKNASYGERISAELRALGY